MPGTVAGPGQVLVQAAVQTPHLARDALSLWSALPALPGPHCPGITTVQASALRTGASSQGSLSWQLGGPSSRSPGLSSFTFRALGMLPAMVACCTFASGTRTESPEKSGRDLWLPSRIYSQSLNPGLSKGRGPSKYPKWMDISKRLSL